MTPYSFATDMGASELAKKINKSNQIKPVNLAVLA